LKLGVITPTPPLKKANLCINAKKWKKQNLPSFLRRGYRGGYKLPLVKGAGGILPPAFVVARFIGGESPMITLKL